MDAEIEAALSRASSAEDRDALWAALEPLREKLASDPNVAHAWAEALQTSPARRTLSEEAEQILEAFPADPDIVGAAGEALVRAAERRPIDEPPLDVGPASTAAGAADRCLGKLGTNERAAPEIGGRLLALRGNALRLLGPGRRADAVAALEQAIALDPTRGERRYDLALVHKHARDFAAAQAELVRARAILGDRKPLLWNLAIAATANGDGDTAREVWRVLGIDAAGEALPFVEGLRPVQVRLATIGAGHGLAPFVPDEAAGFEIVWAQPLSPCHGVIRSPTFRDAIADFGDVVLWDGVPVSVSERDGAPVPCFPILGVLAQGKERRFRFLARQKTADGVDALARALPDDVVLYRHGERVETVCPRCAAGETLVKHEHLPAEEHRIAFGKIVVPEAHALAAFAGALDEARRGCPDVLLAIPSLFEALGDTAQAGKHHKRWGEIERTRTG